MSKKQLVVDIDRDSVRFTRLIGITVDQQFHFNFKDKTDFGYKDQLDVFLAKTDFRTLDWDEYSLSWFGEKTTLLPFAIFNEVDPVKAFQLSFGNSVADNDIDFNRIPEFTGVNIYEIPLWVKSFFVVRFPRMVLQHEGTHCIRGLIGGGSFKLSLLVSLHENHFLLMAIKDQEVKYYNTFEYQTAEDVVYHTAHLLQQYKWQDEKGKLYLVPSHLISENIADGISNLIHKLPPFQQLKIERSNHLISQFQILCV
ncbi:MAG: DUF3822 family protein [Crocinitomicaceae bacterium]